MRDAPIDWDILRRAVAGNVEAVVRQFLNQAEYDAGSKEWRLGGADGKDGRSLGIRADNGLWRDRSTDEGGDLIKLVGMVHGLDPAETGRRLWRALSLDVTVDRRDTPPPAVAPASAEDDLFGTPPPKPDKPTVITPVPDDAPSWLYLRQHRDMGEAAGAWVYRNHQGRMLGVVIRWNTPTEKDPTHKDFRPFVWTSEGRWQAKGWPAPRPLYGLDRLAAFPDAPVCICEGEKSADAAAAMLPGWVCVTSPNGCSNARYAGWGPLVSRQVVIWPDFDTPGEKYAATVRHHLPTAGTLDVQRFAAAIGQPDHANLPVGWDAADVAPAARDRVAEWFPKCVVAATPPAPPKPPTSGPAGKSGEGDDDENEAEKKRRGRQRMYERIVESIKDFLADSSLGRDAIAGWWDEDGERRRSLMTDGTIRQRMEHEARLSGRLWNGKAFDLAFEVITEEMRRERQQHLVSLHTGRPSTQAGKEALAAYITSITGTADPLCISVMAHWMWLVKRRSMRRRVEWDLVPILHGKQGGGKTSVVDALCAAWAELSLPIDASFLVDERKALALVRGVVLRWDEMQGAERSAVEALKRAVTSNLVLWRELFTMSLQQQERTANFIATTNLPVSQVIVDTTGMRRWVEIPVRQVDWESFNKIDMKTVWDAVSEDDPAPIKEHLTVLRTHQDTLVHEDVITAWSVEGFHDRHITVRLPDREIPVTVAGISDAGWDQTQVMIRLGYYCTMSRQAVPTITRVRNRLAQLGWICRRVNVTDPHTGARSQPWRWFPPLKEAQPLTQPLTNAQAEASPTVNQQTQPHPAPGIAPGNGVDPEGLPSQPSSNEPLL